MWNGLDIDSIITGGISQNALDKSSLLENLTQFVPLAQPFLVQFIVFSASRKRILKKPPELKKSSSSFSSRLFFAPFS